jgi:hypothetical protein
MPFSVTSRLLCAALQTYEIAVSGPAPDSPSSPAPPPSSLVGWRRPPSAHVAGDGKSAALVGETQGEIIVAYCGAEPFDSLDRRRMVMEWLSDLDAPLVSAANVPGSVHQGFSHSCNVLWPWVLAQVRGLPSRTKPLYLTGHSKGGALANIAAVKFIAAGLTPFVCTFEGARAGDQAFADGYGKLVNHSTRYEYQDDIVPHLPPDLGFVAAFRNVPDLAHLLSTLVSTYIPVGELRFVDWEGQIVGESPALESQRHAHMIERITMGGWDTVIDGHSIAPGSGAASAICGSVWRGSAGAAVGLRRRLADSEIGEPETPVLASDRLLPLEEPHAPDIRQAEIPIPASDRVVRFDHNSAPYREAIAALDDVESHLMKLGNSIDAETHQHLTAELTAGRTLFESPIVRATIVGFVLGGALTAICVAFPDFAINIAAAAAWQSVLSCFKWAGRMN